MVQSEEFAILEPQIRKTCTKCHVAFNSYWKNNYLIELSKETEKFLAEEISKKLAAGVPLSILALRHNESDLTALAKKLRHLSQALSQHNKMLKEKGAYATILTHLSISSHQMEQLKRVEKLIADLGVLKCPIERRWLDEASVLKCEQVLDSEAICSHFDKPCPNSGCSEKLSSSHYMADEPVRGIVKNVIVLENLLSNTDKLKANPQRIFETIAKTIKAIVGDFTCLQTKKLLTTAVRYKNTLVNEDAWRAIKDEDFSWYRADKSNRRSSWFLENNDTLKYRPVEIIRQAANIIEAYTLEKGNLFNNL